MSRVDVEQGPDTAMAWHFGDPLAEQRAMAEGRAVVELSSREVFTVSGAERLTWLNSLTSQALDELPAGGSAEALLLSPNGHIEYAFTVVDDGQTAWCWTEPGARTGLVAWLESMKFWTPVEIETRDDWRLVWLGRTLEVPAVAAASRVSAVGLGHEVLLTVAAVSSGDEASSGADSSEGSSSGPDSPVALPSGAPFAGQWAHEALRIAAGVPRIGVDTDDRTLPNEIGLYGTALDKGCYRGQETVARVHNLGRPPRRLVRLLFDGSLPEPGTPVLANEKQVGVLTSAAQHHELGPVGLALVKRSVAVDLTLSVAGIAAAQEALVDPEVGEHFRPRL